MFLARKRRSPPVVTPAGSMGDDADIGKKLRLIRKANGFSQRELAKKCGITHSNISMIEQGQVSPSIQSLARILSAVPMSLSHFFSCNEGGDTEPFITEEDFTAQNTHFGALLILPENKTHCDINVKKIIIVAGGDTGSSVNASLVGQVGWLISGELEVTIGEKVAMLGEGQGFYIRAYCPYRFKNVSELNAATLVMTSLFDSK